MVHSEQCILKEDMDKMTSVSRKIKLGSKLEKEDTAHYEKVANQEWLYTT